MKIVLHTFPAKKTGSTDSSEQTQPDIYTPKNLLNTTTIIPRLITIAEILKREFLKRLAEKHSTRLAGLHQYNETGCLEDLGYSCSLGDTQEDRAAEIARALSGKNQ